MSLTRKTSSASFYFSWGGFSFSARQIKIQPEVVSIKMSKSWLIWRSAAAADIQPRTRSLETRSGFSGSLLRLEREKKNLFSFLFFFNLSNHLFVSNEGFLFEVGTIRWQRIIILFPSPFLSLSLSAFSAEKALLKLWTHFSRKAIFHLDWIHSTWKYERQKTSS